MKNKKIFITTILVLSFLVIVIFLKTGGFFNPDKNLSQTLDSSFRKLSNVEKIKILRDIGKAEGSLAVAETLHRLYPDQPANDHELAHVIGETSFIEKGYLGFDVCDSFMMFACYHGVILEAIKQNGYSQDVLLKLGQGCLDLKMNRTTITSCIHGIGHGIMVVNSYNLLASYKDCDRIFSNSSDLFFCYDGASMENIVRRQEQSNSENFLKSDDPYFPCNSVPEKYQPACVREHAHYVRDSFYNKDTLKTQDYCLYFKNELSRKECFGALGASLNQDYADHPEVIIAECKKIMDQYQYKCFEISAALYSFSRQLDKANMICDALLDKNQKTSCLELVKKSEASLDKVVITITDDSFSPAEIKIKLGTTVKFVNKGKSWHWPASNPHPVHSLYSEFDPKKPIAPGEEWSFNFNKKGEWSFHDHLSPYITGKIIVEE